MTKWLVFLFSLAVLIVSMLWGIFGASGIVAFIWGPSVLDTVLGNPPDHTHPASLTFICLMVPGMLLGAAGALFAIVFPLFARFGILFLKDDQYGLRKMAQVYAKTLQKLTGGPHA